MRRLTLRLGEAQAGRTVHTLLRQELLLSAASVRRAKTLPDGILLDGQPVFTNQTGRAGQLLSVAVGDVAGSEQIPPVPGPLTIRYEDEDLVVVEKEGGVPVPPSQGHHGDTLANFLLAHYRDQGLVAAFHPVNRLDKGTTGLMVVAKSGYIHDRLRYALHTERFCREYRAVCIGCPDPKSGTIDAPIGRDETSTVRRCVRPDGSPAVSHYRVLGTRDGLTLVALLPETGRTHQLRVHMASIGCPLAGDWLYGEEDPDLIPRPALHAYALDLDHPVTGEHLSLTAPIPADMARLAPELLTETECASEEI